MKITRPTYTTLVLEYLRKVDDLMSYQQILARVPGTTYGGITAALFHLKKHHCVDMITDVHGQPFFFALPPEEDTRSHTVKERVEESRPRKTRRRSIFGWNLTKEPQT